MEWVGYQKRWLADESRQRAVVKARRIGFSEVVAFQNSCRAVGVDLIKGTTHKPVSQNLVSAGQEQAKVLLQRHVKHLTALGLGTTAGDIIQRQDVFSITLKNGESLSSYSSNPKTIRGGEGDVTLDEFAQTPRPKEVWAAASPLADSTLGNPEGYRVNVIFTPEGDDNMAYEIARGKLRDSFSLHEVNIYDAVKDGFPIDIEEKRRLMGDPDLFSQEYECNFLAAAMRYISAKTYDQAVYHREDWKPEGTALHVAGMDVGRTKHASAIVRGERLGDTTWHHSTEVEVGMDWDSQEGWVDGHLDRVQRMAVDATSIGSQFAERMTNRWPGRVEPVNFNLKSKEELATGLKLALERGRFRPRADDTDLRRDILALKRIVTPMGNITYDAPVDKRGHADRAWAAALMIYAAGGAARGMEPPRAYTDAHRPESRRKAPRSRRGAWK
jgi:phage FluMu gp28-like protein